MEKIKNIYERLLSYSDNMKIIDTHEHLHPYKNYLGDEPDVICDYMEHYITTDLQSARMIESDLNKVKNYKLDLEERFKILEPYLDKVKNTSYYRSLEIAAEKIHGINGLTIKTIRELNERFKKAAGAEDYNRHILKELCNIEVSINDNWSDDMKWSTTKLFVPAWQPNSYISPDINAEVFNTANLTLDEFCEQYEQHFLKQKNDGMKTLKITLAYSRSLFFEDVDYNTADGLFVDFMKKLPDIRKNAANAGVLYEFPKKLQDYIMCFVLKTAEENNFIIQIHTGLQEGMRNNLENSNPMLLKNLFGKYPNLKFDIFHTGYPYERELMVLAKTHENVYIDFCWTHIISPFAAKNSFYEMLDILPYTKIFGFGGDYVFLDGVVGHLTMAKQNICTVLAQKVVNNECDMDLAENILQSVLYDNAKETYNL
jgi:glucuronate isomerase